MPRTRSLCNTLSVGGFGLIGMSIPLYFSKEIFNYSFQNLLDKHWTKIDSYIGAIAAIAVVSCFAFLTGAAFGKVASTFGHKCCPRLCG